MLLQPTRLNPNAFDLGDGGKAASLERERMQLAREQFENTKAQQRQQLELQKMEEGGRTARERMISDRAAAAAQAAKAAEAKKTQLALMGEFTKANGAGDVEGARAMLPLMDAAGLSVELLGEQDGLPTYRIGEDPEAAARAQGAIGYPGDDSGTLAGPLGIPSTEDAFKRSLGASEQAAQTGMPARAPDQPDYTGSVPRNVLDMGAIHAQTLARLTPALAGIVGSYPQQYQDSAEQTAGAVRGLGLPASKTVELFDKLRGGPDSLTRAEIAANAQQGEQSAKAAVVSSKQSQKLFKDGMGYAKTAAGEFNLKDVIERRKTVAQARDVLVNKDDADDYLAGATISRMMGDKGATTENDVARALGTSAMSFVERIKAGLYKEAIGGLSLPQKNALLGVLRTAEAADTQRVHDYLSNIDDQIASPDMDPDVARGLKSARNMLVPRDIRDGYDKARSKNKKPAAGSSASDSSGATGMFNMEEDARKQAAGEAGTVIPSTSRIAFTHNNPGNLKFADQTGAERGEKADDGGYFAKFKTVDAGMNALRDQVLKDSERGLSVRDFVVKYAPPGSNDTEKYIADALKELRAEETDSLAELDPYDVVRFMARHESSTVLPDQYAKAGKSGAGSVDVAAPLPEPKTPEEKRMQGIMSRRTR